MGVQYGRVVALRFEELRRMEIPAEVIGSIDALFREFIQQRREVIVLLIEERYFGSHIQS